MNLHPYIEDILTGASLNTGRLFFFVILSTPRMGVINELVLEILPYDFLLDNEAENTNFNN